MSEHYVSHTKTVWGVRAVGRDAFMWSGDSESDARAWLHSLRVGYGHDVELVLCEVSTRTFTRRTDWQPAPTDSGAVDSDDQPPTAPAPTPHT